MPELTPETAKQSEQLLWLFVTMGLLFVPFVLAAIHSIRKSNEWQEEKHVSELSEDEIQEVAGARATGTVFFLLALLVVFLLTVWGGTLPHNK